MTQITTTKNVDERDPLLSPNGAWLAYTSNENRRDDVFIASVADPTLKWQVSSGGGRSARWRSDGRDAAH